MLRAYKTELHLNNGERSQLTRCADASRFVFNWSLADRIARHEAGLSTSKFEQKRRFNALKGVEHSWLYDVPYTIEEAAFDHCERAFQNFFRRVKAGDGEKPGFPKFKSRFNDHQGFTVRGSITVESARIKLPRLGWLRLAERGYLPSDGVKVLSVNVSVQAGHWMVSLQVEEADCPAQAPTTDILAIHPGVVHLATLSDGAVFENPRHLAQRERALAHAQRALARCQKGSNNRSKAKLHVAAIHRRVSNARQHGLHEVSHYATAHAGPEVVVMQDFDVRGMVEGVPIAHALNKRIHDASMSELRRQVNYKAQWAGQTVLTVPTEAPTSKRCSSCGTVNADLTLSQQHWVCPSCGVRHERDSNAAHNLLYFADIQREVAEAL